MKKLISLLAMFALVLQLSAQEFPEIEIGAKAPLLDVPMKGINGNALTLNEVAKENGLLVVFSCNTCPWVVMWENRYPDIAKWTNKNDVGFVLVNSNYNKFDGDDSMENMRKHASEKGYADLNYVMDSDSRLANAIGAKTTPHVFLFNSDMELVYKGAIDDNAQDKDKVSDPYLKNALGAVGAGKSIAVNTTTSKGCSIKRKLN